MTVKRETTFWKNVKKLLEDGVDKYIVSRLESYVTPGFPDCVIFHNVTGFFTVELKIIKASNKVTISPFQIGWNMRHSLAGGQCFILVGGLPKAHVKLFHGSKTKELAASTWDLVPGLYEGRLEDLHLWRVVASNSQTP
jgi:hypothetical protein|tara:strand:+ start:274 stop:690 length:417 start_codon:yes stop_codon:yes gene_type:complete